MDIRNEDKMVKQIEKSLSNNLSENLYYAGRTYGRSNQVAYKVDADTSQALSSEAVMDMENPIISFDYSNPTSISRAEYIRQARESCLRQLSELQTTARAYDSYYLDHSIHNREQNSVNDKTTALTTGGDASTELLNPYSSQTNELSLNSHSGTATKKDKPANMLQETSRHNRKPELDENMREIMAFRFLVIRIVCAIVIFLSVFLVDKINLVPGKIYSNYIQEYVTGNDSFENLEDTIVTWFKK